jgi:hypothetical protein
MYIENEAFSSLYLGGCCCKKCLSAREFFKYDAMSTNPHSVAMSCSATMSSTASRSSAFALTRSRSRSRRRDRIPACWRAATMLRLMMTRCARNQSVTHRKKKHTHTTPHTYVLTLSRRNIATRSGTSQRRDMPRSAIRRTNAMLPRTTFHAHTRVHPPHQV